MQALDTCLSFALVTGRNPPVRLLQVLLNPGLRFDSVEARLHPLRHVPDDLPDRMSLRSRLPRGLRRGNTGRAVVSGSCRWRSTSVAREAGWRRSEAEPQKTWRARHRLVSLVGRR